MAVFEDEMISHIGSRGKSKKKEYGLRLLPNRLQIRSVRIATRLGETALAVCLAIGFVIDEGRLKPALPCLIGIADALISAAMRLGEPALSFFLAIGFVVDEERLKPALPCLMGWGLVVDFQ